MDTFHKSEFTGTWRRLFSRVKKHIIWGVLKSVTGMQASFWVCTTSFLQNLCSVLRLYHILGPLYLHFLLGQKPNYVLLGCFCAFGV